MTEQDHINTLEKLCRVCDQLLSKPKKVQKGYLCSENKEAHLKVFEISTDNDNSHIHPPNFCHSCRSTIYADDRASSQGREYSHITTLFTWTAHSETECGTCDHISSLRRVEDLTR